MGKERPLDYFPAYASIRRHKKTRRLQRLLIGRNPTILTHWLIMELFLEACDEYPDGHLRGVHQDELADLCGWPGDPVSFGEHIIESGWVERRGGELWIANWDEYGGRVIRRRELDRRRQQKRRSNVTRDIGIVTRDSRGRPRDPIGYPQTSRKSPHKEKEKEKEKEISLIANDVPVSDLPDDHELSLREISDFGFSKFNQLGGTAEAKIRGLMPIYAHELASVLRTDLYSWNGAFSAIVKSRQILKQNQPRGSPIPAAEGNLEKVTRELMQEAHERDRTREAGAGLTCRSPAKQALIEIRRERDRIYKSDD